MRYTLTMEESTSQFFVVKQGGFEGPLHVLLDMIERRKLSISDFSLSQVADDYISQVSDMEKLPIEETANFITVCSALLLIKARTLLPGLNLTEEEKGNIDELEAHLKELQRVREQAKALMEIAGRNAMKERVTLGEQVIIFAPGKAASLNALVLKKVVLAMLERARLLTAKSPQALVGKIVNLESVITSFVTRIAKGGTFSFSKLAQDFHGHEKMETIKKSIIVSFVALLELMKRGVVNIKQTGHYGEIEISGSGLATPRYE